MSLPQSDSVDPWGLSVRVQEMQRRRRRVVLIVWGVFWGCALMVAAVSAIVCTVARGFGFGFAAWAGTLIIAGLVFLPLWLISSAFWVGARAGTAVQQRLRDRGRR